jgi:hypothetical protein
MDTLQNTRRYAPEKPKREQDCYWWDPASKSCRLGPGNCYYMIPERPKRPVHPCDGCPFAIPLPCIGYCIKELRKGVGKR